MSMTTITQDPIDRVTLHIKELRRVPGVHGPVRLVRNLILDLFTSLLRLLASLAEQARTGTLPDTAPAPHGGASPRPPGAPDSPRVRPPEPLLRQIPEAASRGSMMHGQFEQPEMTHPIAEAPQVGRILPPPCRMPEVEPPAGLPRPARVRTAKNPSGLAPARPRHVDDGTPLPSRGAGIFWTTEAGFLRFDSKKWVSAGGH